MSEGAGVEVLEAVPAVPGAEAAGSAPAPADPLQDLLDAWTRALDVLPSTRREYGKDAGQIVLRFEVQEGFVVLPKSTKPARIKSNLDIFGFELTDAEMDAIRALDTGKGTHDPDDPINAERLLSFRVHD